jgi:hypothetical protein
MVWGLFGVLAAFGLGRLRGDARDAAFAVCAVRAQPLVDAISRFEHERGRPPSRLEDLVPAFLAEVPGTGLSAYPRFELDRPGGEARTAAAWELQVRCSKSFFDFDVFFYWPTQNYPREIYGGWVERIGTWAYVHE